MARTLGDAFVRVRPDVSTFPRELGTGMQAAERTWGQRLGGFAKKAGVVFGAAALIGVGAFVKGSVPLEAAFSKSMSQIQANLQAPKKDMRELSALALKMGADTVFSANDASKAMLELARGGLSAATIQGGALKGTLTLAAAGELSMGQAANTAVKAMGQFNLSGKQMDQVAAALAGAANASSASVSDLSQALAAGGLAAHGAGLNIQETTGILAAFANKGLEGSDAGTALKTMLTRLVPTTKSAAVEMEQLGLFSAKTGSAFVKSNGEFKSAAQIAGILQKHTKDLSSSERQKALSIIFGSDAQRAANVLATEGAAGIRKMIKATSDQNAAQRMAKANMRGTAGAIEQMKGSLETAQLAFGQAMKPVTIFAAHLVTKIANGAVPIIQDFGKILRRVIHGIDLSFITRALSKVDIGGMFKRLQVTLQGISWGKINDALHEMGGALKDAGGELPGFQSTMSVTGTVVQFLADHVDTLAKAMPYLVAGFVALKAAQLANNVVGRNSIVGFIAETTSTTALAASNFALARSRKADRAAALQQQGAERVGMLTKIRSTVATVASTVAQKAAALASKAWAGAQWLLNAAMSANPLALVAIALVALGVALVIAWKKSDTFREIVTKAWGKIREAIAAAWEKVIKPALKAMGDFITKRVGPAIKSLWEKVVRPTFQKIGQVVRWAWNTVLKPIFKAWWGYYTNVLFPVIRFLWEKIVQPVFSRLGSFIKATWQGVIRPAFDALRGGVGKVRDAFKAGVDRIKTIWAGIKEAARAPIAFVVNTVYNDGLRKVINLIPGVPDLPEVHFAKGGPVTGGTPGKDSVVARMMPGEHVWTTDEVKKIGGHAAVFRMRELVRKGAFDRGALRSGGDLGWPIPKFAAGGSLTSEQIARGQAFARSQAGKPYIWGGVGPEGYDCSGFMSAVTNAVRGDYPAYHRLGTSTSFPWPGFLPGVGQFTVGAFTGSPGHVAGTLGGLNVESTNGSVRVGAGARGGTDPMFTRLAHLGAGGSAAAEAGGFWDAVKAIKGLAGKMAGWLSSLASMGGWGGLIRQMVVGVGNEFRGWVNDKIPGPGPFPHFDRGGLARGRGMMIKDTMRPERVLSPDATSDLDEVLRLLLVMLQRGGFGPLVAVENLHARDEAAAAYALRAELQKMLSLWSSP